MEFILNNRELKYEEDGKFYIKLKNKKWKEISICISNGRYKYLHISKKVYLLHRVIGYLFLGLNIDDETQLIDHIDGDKFNNNLENLRIVNNQQNCFNRKSKGFYFDKRKNKYQAKICINQNQIHLGMFDTEEEAQQAYLNAKQIYHQF